MRTLYCHQVLWKGLDSLYHFSTQRGEAEEKQQAHHSSDTGGEGIARPTHFLPHNVSWTSAPRRGPCDATIWPVPVPEGVWADGEPISISSLSLWSRCFTFLVFQIRLSSAIPCYTENLVLFLRDSSSQETRYIWDRRGHNPMSILWLSSSGIWTPLSWM